MEKAIIDRCEGNYFVVETKNGHMRNIPISWSLEPLHEGDCILVDEKAKTCSLDKSATKERKERIESLMQDLFEPEK